MARKSQSKSRTVEALSEMTGEPPETFEPDYDSFPLTDFDDLEWEPIEDEDQKSE